MRWIAALLTCAATALASGTARAADDAQAALFGAAFSDARAFDAPVALTGSDSFPAHDAFSAPRYLPGRGLVQWTRGEVASFSRDGAPYVDQVQLSTTALDRLPAVALMRPAEAGYATARQTFDLTYVRNWPSMLSIEAGRLSLDITPHAGLGVSSGGGQSAEAGALVRLGEAVQDRVLQAVGLRSAGVHPRWFLFAGASGRAVGLNLLRGKDSARRDDLADDGFVRQAQAGLGVSRGPVHALLGYTHEVVTMRALGEQNRNDDRVGLRLAIR